MNRNDFINKIEKIESESHFKSICLNNYDFRSAADPEHRKMLMGYNQDWTLNDYSFKQFLDRTGLNCSTLNDSEFISKNNELVDNLINKVLEGNEEFYSTAYVRQNEILAAHSKNYKPLQISELIKTLESELKNRYSDFIFEDGFYSDEITIVDYSIVDSFIISAYKKSLNLQDYDVKVVIRLVTSNLGLSGANLYPLIGYKLKPSKKYIYIPTSDRAIVLKHEGDASIQRFADNANTMFSVTETLPEKFNELNNIKIEYPTHCCINLAEKVGIPAKLIAEIAENIAFVYPNRSITGKELYLMFADVLNKVSDEKQRFALFEKVGKGLRILKENTSEIDVPKIKWKRLQNITADEGQDFIPFSEPTAQLSFAG